MNIVKNLKSRISKHASSGSVDGRTEEEFRRSVINEYPNLSGDQLERVVDFWKENANRF